MGKKVFVSYKYGDEQVAKLKDTYYDEVDGEMKWVRRKTKARDFVDVLQNLIGKDNMNLGEKDGDSLEEFADSTIQGKLKDKIFQSSVTIVVISKGMKDPLKLEKDQWIPWEISYSLQSIKRENQASKMNAILGVVLPDEHASYDWYYRENLDCNSTTHFTNQLFSMLKKNMFNLKNTETKECNGTTINVSNNPSFIKTVKWSDFNSSSYNNYIDAAVEIKDNQLANDSYKMKIKLD
ncbi:TIR domain-containing protein [Dokdonia sp. R78006]|uniref:TIR domain-containing protein n=1 Tax=Dokdonia sp. R78006 TaxID=3093866 RepID=UPI0036D43F5C